MSIPKKISSYMDSKHVSYSHILHPPGYTAEEVANKIHCLKHELAKTIAVHMDGRDILAVIPASDMLDIHLLQQSFGAKHIKFFSENELNQKFKDCETGAMPIFGHLYGMEVIVSDNLLEDGEIYFNAGTHIDAIKCSMEDFIKLEKPIFAHISNLHKDNFVSRDLGY